MIRTGAGARGQPELVRPARRKSGGGVRDGGALHAEGRKPVHHEDFLQEEQQVQLAHERKV